METVIQQYGLDTILTEETRAWLRQETFQKGELLCTTGAAIDRMYFIVAGKVKISAASSEGKQRILRFKTPLTVIGDAEFINEREVLNTVEAVTDVEVLSVPYAILREHNTTNVFLQFLLRTITAKWYADSKSASHHVLYTVEERFAGYLLSIASEASDSLFYQEMRTSNLHDVADWLGTSYRHLNRIITKLCEEEILVRRRGKIIIVDLERIREKANGNSYE
ncbi:MULTISPECIES: Crp/Fnr family transcriptional regulator [Exiguobacterium]|uniref:Crp/Fnr family transcriptional regulator n=1 Tax=Exiguobacterium indicum TaxID=296995 RepID=A0AAW3M9N8_9BACL|nr:MULTISPECIES: Crp/Fnr family transcriptional regulator [Exiguobacterium]AHA28718.1 transcriptional regulator [Exiguobacterium sp. MH3]KTR25456.1 hypothetical protein RSA11_15180 [Exiguobacterium indicum]MCQ4091493.1 Crp/Fnr family transcriptional regulator [Exiguobacterium sp. LL15]OAI85276.1 hypothetical protein AYO36_12120 [Exiguobacterium sp. KKBO11]